MAKNLYVGNLSYSTTSADLSELFGALGEVTSVNLITDRMSGRSKGFAFVEMAEYDAAQKAINELNGKEIDGRAIKVAEARPKRDDRGGGAGGGGRRRRRGEGPQATNQHPPPRRSSAGPPVFLSLGIGVPVADHLPPPAD